MRRRRMRTATVPTEPIPRTAAGVLLSLAVAVALVAVLLT
ncbi:hypothetical protein EV193_104154 [Herbihabitans rhizosphaerae]|uniref:Uncharacterized protein n=1 Tax=Herbihabitans rhizosphaerae TaxID=1872711 RepID=A0A4V2ESW0_9PSEU|nr:hypothetical protein EV193_104154 [Herbihabitans rhizosphaerae]